jgi:predicted transcriptional regulator
MTIRAAIKEGLSLLDFAIVTALQTSPPMSRSEMEQVTGASEPTIRRATIRLRERGMIATDRKHPVGGPNRREARYFLINQPNR